MGRLSIYSSWETCSEQEEAVPVQSQATANGAEDAALRRNR